MIDPATAIVGGTGAGALLGFGLRFMAMRAENELEKERERNRHEEAVNQSVGEHQDRLNQVPIDKGEPFERSLLWGLWKSKGVQPDRRVPHALSLELRMLVASYCWAIFVCFACGDIVIIERPIEGDPSVFELLFGIIKYTADGKRVYVQTLAGLGSGLLATASVVITTTFIGIRDRK